MPDAYDIHDALFLQKESNTSAADSLSVFACSSPPAGRVRTVLAACVTCSANETQTYWFGIYNVAHNQIYPVTYPTSRAIVGATGQTVPCLTEGMEIKLFPGEYLGAYRAAATAGSTITGVARFIETDIQYYVELDKHKVLRRRSSAMQGFQGVSRPGGGGGGGPVIDGGGEGGGGGGRGLPI